jgi:hypothetical protein
MCKFLPISLRPDPDPYCQCGSGSLLLITSAERIRRAKLKRIHADPDSEHC